MGSCGREASSLKPYYARPRAVTTSDAKTVGLRTPNNLRNTVAQRSRFIVSSTSQAECVLWVSQCAILMHELSNPRFAMTINSPCVPNRITGT